MRTARRWMGIDVMGVYRFVIPNDVPWRSRPTTAHTRLETPTRDPRLTSGSTSASPGNARIALSAPAFRKG